MAGEKYIPDGVWLTCDKGTIPSQFTSTPRKTKFYSQIGATNVDLIPMVNIKPFGACHVTKPPTPCTPAPMLWTDVHEGSLRINGKKPLLDRSKCQCARSGKISIHFSKIDAVKHVASEKLHEFADTAKDISVKSFFAGIALGIAGIGTLALAPVTGGASLAAVPFLFTAAAGCMEVAAVTFEAAVVADVASFAAEPSKAGIWIVVGDTTAIVGGKLLGKWLGAGVKEELEAGEEAIAKDSLELGEEATAKQKGNFGEVISKDNMLNNPEIKSKGLELKRIGNDAPSGVDDKIKRGIDGIYENHGSKQPPKFVIDEAKFNTAKLNPNTKDGPQMSDDWLRGNKRLENQVGPEKAREIERALKNDQVDKVLSRVDDRGNVQTYRLDKNGKIISTWP